ncbi:DUF6429 family protein [cf. Phormidesmis sp. LEGE 11477]|uniref:DUF6429 family protein n=1 Tax=cf. Phormidesmis sp. LEGE 11477 TaxID=1828680 RepID=UPI00187E3EC4|nr:DUF6429 family protein [cf. Phormidesmis sp. LEGE 11477]MBE9064741.1 hypothetical protein [cf. Phormidesmis sp. LEGE 11477]
MEYDYEAIDEATLALMFLTRTHGDAATWKGYDWDTTNRLHEKGLLGNPTTKNKSIPLTIEGQAKCEELFKKLFVKEAE